MLLSKSLLGEQKHKDRQLGECKNRKSFETHKSGCFNFNEERNTAAEKLGRALDSCSWVQGDAESTEQQSTSPAREWDQMHCCCPGALTPSAWSLP